MRVNMQTPSSLFYGLKKKAKNPPQLSNPSFSSCCGDSLVNQIGVSEALRCSPVHLPQPGLLLLLVHLAVHGGDHLLHAAETLGHAGVVLIRVCGAGGEGRVGQARLY